MLSATERRERLGPSQPGDESSVPNWASHGSAPSLLWNAKPTSPYCRQMGRRYTDVPNTSESRHVVDAFIEGVRLAHRELIAKMRAEMSVAEFELPLVDAIGQREAEYIIGRIQVLALFHIQSGYRGAVEIQLEPRGWS